MGAPLPSRISKQSCGNGSLNVSSARASFLHFRCRSHLQRSASDIVVTVPSHPTNRFNFKRPKAQGRNAAEIISFCKNRPRYTFGSIKHCHVTSSPSCPICFTRLNTAAFLSDRLERRTHSLPGFSLKTARLALSSSRKLEISFLSSSANHR